MITVPHWAHWSRIKWVLLRNSMMMAELPLALSMGMGIKESTSSWSPWWWQSSLLGSPWSWEGRLRSLVHLVKKNRRAADLHDDGRAHSWATSSSWRSAARRFFFTSRYQGWDGEKMLSGWLLIQARLYQMILRSVLAVSYPSCSAPLVLT